MKEKDLVLKVENVSKQYRLGLVGTGTLQDDLKRWWYKVRGKEDPFLKVGAENDRSKKTDDKYVWALKDINFEVKKGEVLGIIGKNGAGKSTLLKLLSKVADPSTGSIKYKGRIAALLEVGTGFHPELTGRENIFLNGAVLGMNKEEIASKVDEIIEFSGVAQYVDTPVKRYSSGMKVRLGFAVAAHLEPDILIVDEVLAVGDAEFQKKCIGKMQDVAGEGRTVLFVSHNIGSVKALCKTGMYLKNGQVEFIGEVNETINKYLSESNFTGDVPIPERTDRTGNGDFKILNINFKNQEGNNVREILSGDSLTIEFEYVNKTNFSLQSLIFGCGLSDTYGVNVVSWISDEMKAEITDNGSTKIVLEIPSLTLRPNSYNLSYQASMNSTGAKDMEDVLIGAISLSVLESDFFNSGKTIRNGYASLINANYKF